MYKNISTRWKENIYKNVPNVLNIYFDGVLVNPTYITEFKLGNTLFDENLELGCTPSQYIELQIHKKANIPKPKVITVEYGILINALTVKELNQTLIQDLSGIKIKSLSNVNKNFEMIPIGIYNLDNYSDIDDNLITIKAFDNMIKLDLENGYYDASKLINEKGYATLGEIAQDICNKKGVELRFYFFF